MSNADIDEQLNKLLSIKEKSYTFTIGSNLHDKLEKHLFSLKAINKKCSKGKWVYEAIAEKLKLENVGDLSKQRRIQVFLDDNISNEIEKRIQIFKKVYSSYSKKQWILEAIHEKLDRELKLIKEEFKKTYATEMDSSD
ncbi:hypothetical protein DB41_AV00030 [Neochlamydia sp. TUME1]|uniref:hypothetical protein n=1 Tax=Neochlamydia sp. TUME1 TaxID=1478174 RepID=UPI00057EFD23|nr:hypothetical protein [Neochlamydia sp. TUME1]KIC71563.1 hypothetical protein DB41_AV00030 [Neochlamydia sp. TUME1]